MKRLLKIAGAATLFWGLLEVFNKKVDTYVLTPYGWLKDTRSLGRRFRNWFVHLAGIESVTDDLYKIKNERGEYNTVYPVWLAGRRVTILKNEIRIKNRIGFWVIRKDGMIFNSPDATIEKSFKWYKNPPKELIELFSKAEEQASQKSKEEEDIPEKFKGADGV